MDGSRFDRLSRALAEATSRRSLFQTAAALAVAGVTGLQGDAADARRNKSANGFSVEHFRHKKRWYCLNGTSLRRYRRKQESLLAQGAAVGKCGASPCVPVTCADLSVICGQASDGCGGTLSCGDCDTDLTCCTGQCVNLENDNDNCGECGIVCDVANFFECSVGLCQTG